VKELRRVQVKRSHWSWVGGGHIVSLWYWEWVVLEVPVSEDTSPHP
jgi:hypothetical protein